MYDPRLQKISSCLPGAFGGPLAMRVLGGFASADAYLFMAPSRYVFKGAEVFVERPATSADGEDGEAESSASSSQATDVRPEPSSSAGVAELADNVASARVE